MIKPIQMYACYCDNCGKRWEDGDGLCAYLEEEAMHDMVADDSDWHIEADKHYCPDCFKGYDDNDKIILLKLVCRCKAPKPRNLSTELHEPYTLCTNCGLEILNQKIQS
jgi:hypothetical protein